MNEIAESTTIAPDKPAKSAPDKSLRPLPDGRRVYRELELAKMMGIHPQTVRRWRRTGTGPQHFRVNARFVAYTSDAIADWLAAGGGK